MRDGAVGAGGIFGIHKTNYVVKTTEFGGKPRGGRGDGVISGFTK